ncbi:MAG TPA: Holliday junction branch migration protein RuvA [Kiritimatiellia bacterium]|jgi:Holliday junction DNA helicase RuvA
MITFLEGTLVEKDPTRVVVNVGGVGYEAFIPLSSYDRLPNPDTPCKLLTYHHVREDIEALYGFVSDAERKLFLLLLGISGIGPKIALSALGGLSVREFKTAIVTGDVKRLSSISGVGKKTAERMVVELKDKLSQGEALEALTGSEPETAADVRTRDAILALVSLGYKQVEAQAAVKKVGPQPTVEEIVRKALASR